MDPTIHSLVIRGAPVSQTQEHDYDFNQPLRRLDHEPGAAPLRRLCPAALGEACPPDEGLDGGQPPGHPLRRRGGGHEGQRDLLGSRQRARHRNRDRADGARDGGSGAFATPPHPDTVLFLARPAQQRRALHRGDHPRAHRSVRRGWARGPRAAVHLHLSVARDRPDGRRPDLRLRGVPPLGARARLGGGRSGEGLRRRTFDRRLPAPHPGRAAREAARGSADRVY